MKVRFIDRSVISSSITYGKVYKVIREDKGGNESGYLIKNDIGKEIWLYKHRFEVVEDKNIKKEVW